MKKTLAFTFILISFLFVSCYRCDTPKLLGSAVFSQAQKDCIPYQTNQKIRFLRDNSNDTTTLTVGSISNQIDKIPCAPECCDYYLFEDYRLTLTADYPHFKFEVSLYKNSSEAADTTVFGVNVFLNKTGFYINHPEQNCANTIANRTCFDSLELNHQMYYEVIQRRISAPDSVVKPIKITYNKTKGILQFQLSDSTSYTLLP